jgi:hypothetical protein
MMRQFFVTYPNSKRCNKNRKCECGEDCVNCPSDCLLQSGERCGNGVCEVRTGEGKKRKNRFQVVGFFSSLRSTRIEPSLVLWIALGIM